MPVLAVFKHFSNVFLRFEFFLRQLFLVPAPAVLGNRDGSIRALRKVRIRNETDNFIESISQMVPRWSPEVPDGPQMVPRGPRWSPEVPKTDNFLRPVPKSDNFFRYGGIQSSSTHG